MLCNLRANLCGIAVDCLAACNYQIIVNISKCSCNRRRRSPCVSTAQYSVSHKDCFVCTHSHCFTEYIISFWKSHCKYGNFCAHFIFYSKCCFQTCFVIRIHDRKHGCPIQRTVRVKFHAAFGIWYLFNTYNDFHGSFTPYTLFKICLLF